MIPQTDQHKLVGFFAGVISGAVARYGFNLPLEISVIILNGVLLLVSTIWGKYSNPTGANKSETRKALESVVRTETSEHTTVNE